MADNQPPIYTPLAIDPVRRADFRVDTMPESLGDIGSGGGALRVGWCPGPPKPAPRGPHPCPEVGHEPVGVFIVTHPTVVFLRQGWPFLVDREGQRFVTSPLLGRLPIPPGPAGPVKLLPQRRLSVEGELPEARLGLDHAVLLEAPGFKIWGHWLIDQFPRLYLLHQLGILPRANFVLSAPLPGWASQFLDVLGIRDDQLHVVGPAGFRIDSVLVPSFFQREGQLFIDRLREVWRFLETALLGSEPERAPPSPGTRIYFSRANWRGGSSTISNEPELRALLEDHGFQVVYPELLSLKQQVALMTQADIVVGEDGSAMHDVAFCRDHVATVTIHSRLRPRVDALRPSVFQRAISQAVSPLAYFHEPEVQGRRIRLDVGDFRSLLRKVIAEQADRSARLGAS